MNGCGVQPHGYALLLSMTPHPFTQPAPAGCIGHPSAPLHRLPPNPLLIDRRQGTPLRGALLRRYAASHRCATLAVNGARVRVCGDPAANAASSPPGYAARPPGASACPAVKGRSGPCQSGFFSR